MYIKPIIPTQTEKKHSTAKKTKQLSLLYLKLTLIIFYGNPSYTFRRRKANLS